MITNDLTMEIQTELAKADTIGPVLAGYGSRAVIAFGRATEEVRLWRF